MSQPQLFEAARTSADAPLNFDILLQPVPVPVPVPLKRALRARRVPAPRASRPCAAAASRPSSTGLSSAKFCSACSAIDCGISSSTSSDNTPGVMLWSTLVRRPGEPDHDRAVWRLCRHASPLDASRPGRRSASRRTSNKCRVSRTGTSDLRIPRASAGGAQDHVSSRH